VKAYVTAGDYLTGALSASGLPFDPAPLIDSLLRLHPREVYLQVLVALNHAAHHPELTEAYRDRFLARLNPAMAQNVHRALDGTVDGMTRALLARQPVLRAMRAVLTHRPTGDSAPGNLAAAVPGLDPELAGMLLVHLVAAQLHVPYTAGDPKFGDLPEGLAMEMVANGLFHGHERPDVLLARTRMLWSTYGTQIDMGPGAAPGLDGGDVHAEAVGGLGQGRGVGQGQAECLGNPQPGTVLASRFHARARGATIRADLIDVAARLARRGRGQLALHLPQYWHRESEWMSLFEAACGPPARVA
jgi:hypothetical protein